MSKTAYYYGVPPDYSSKKVHLSSYSISIPGFRTFLDPHQSSYKKAIWGIVMLVSLCMAVFQICERAQNFLSNPVRLEFNILNLGSIQFPSFTICPYNVFASKRIQDELENKSIATVYDLLSLPSYDLNTIWNMTQMDLSSLLTLCKFEGGKTCNDPPLEQWKTQATVLGTCHTIDFQLVKYYGISSAFMLSTNSSNHFYEGAKSHNYMVTIHNKNDDVTYAALTDAFEAYESTLTHINYFHNLKLYQNFSNRPCYSNEHYQTCKLRCYDNRISQRSNCRLPFMKTSNLRLCSTPDEFRRIYPIPIQENLFFDDVGPCVTKCGLSCESNIYEENMETKTYSDRKHYSLFKVTPLREGMTIITEKFSYSIVAFICDVGAILGLYLGISVLSFTEVVELLIDVAKDKRAKAAIQN